MATPHHTNRAARIVGRWLTVTTIGVLLTATAAAQSPGRTQSDPPQGSGGPGGEPARGEQQVVVTDYGVVDINVQNTPITSVLEMLAFDSRRNIIVGRDVSGNVSVNLFDVTFEEALSAILEPNGYGYVVEGNFIYVLTKDEIRRIEDARRTTESRIFEVEYLSATDAYEFISPLLSGDGRASHRGDVRPGIRTDLSDVGADDYAFGAKLVVNDYPENLDRIAELLRELDTPPQQVLVEATILQTALDEANAFGVDFSILGSMNFTDISNPLAPVGNLLAGRDAESGFQPPDNRGFGVASTPGGTRDPGTLKIGIIRNDFSAFLKLLDEVTDTTVLARPRIMALNRQRAEVLVGARVGYLSTTATETSTTQTVEFLDTGIQLIFRPFISRDGSIRMEMAPSVSEASLRTVTDAQGLQVTIPDELTNELTTNVRVRDGQTLVLGGLFKESTRITRRQVPLLGDIPVLGNAFRGQDDAVSRDEIIFLITPNIIHDQQLAQIGREMMDYVEYAQVGARAGLLPFSRSNLSRHYNQQAMEAHTRGEKDLAVYYINNSLRIHPTQPEMVRFREQITSEVERPYERSIIERVFRKHIGEVGTREEPRDPIAAAEPSDSDDVTAMPFLFGPMGQLMGPPFDPALIDEFNEQHEPIAQGQQPDFTDDDAVQEQQTAAAKDPSSEEDDPDDDAEPTKIAARPDESDASESEPRSPEPRSTGGPSGSGAEPINPLVRMMHLFRSPVNFGGEDRIVGVPIDPEK